MSNKVSKKKTDQLDEVVGDVIENAENFFQKYKNILIYSLVGIMVIVVGYFGYTEFVSKPKQQEAYEQMFRAEQYFAVDSFNIALNGDGNTLGFNDIINNYGSTAAGNLARFYAGVCHYHLGDYSNAIAQLNKFSSDDEVVGARALCVIGDAYAEIGELDNAVKYFIKAANHKNNSYSATYLMKVGRVYEAQGKYNDALKAYDRVKKEYPNTTEAREVDKYIERAGLLAGK